MVIGIIYHCSTFILLSSSPVKQLSYAPRAVWLTSLRFKAPRLPPEIVSVEGMGSRADKSLLSVDGSEKDHFRSVLAPKSTSRAIFE